MLKLQIMKMKQNDLMFANFKKEKNIRKEYKHYFLLKFRCWVIARSRENPQSMSQP